MHLCHIQPLYVFSLNPTRAVYFRVQSNTLFLFDIELKNQVFYYQVLAAAAE